MDLKELTELVLDNDQKVCNQLRGHLVDLLQNLVTIQKDKEDLVSQVKRSALVAEQFANQAQLITAQSEIRCQQLNDKIFKLQVHNEEMTRALAANKS